MIVMIVMIVMMVVMMMIVMGVMVFLHGAGMSDDFPAGWGVREFLVEQNADHFGWIGVIPEGTKERGGRGWNLKPTGVDEVGFVKAMVRSVAAQQQVPSSAPRVALGFSNGAGLALLLGCAFDKSVNLAVAHVAVEIKDNSDQQGCDAFDRSTPKWSGVGDEDFFLEGSGRRGLLRDFSQFSIDAGCVEEEVTTVVTGSAACYGYDSCPAAGEVCVYEGLGHAVPATATSQAWSYLTGGAGGFWLGVGDEAWPTPEEPAQWKNWDEDSDFRKEGAEDEDFDKEDFEKEDWDKEDFEKDDWDKEDFEKDDSDKEDFAQEDSDKGDFDKEDWDKADFDKEDWDKGDFDKEDWGEEDFDKEDWDKEKGNGDARNVLTMDHTWMGVTGQRAYAQQLPREGTRP